MRNRPKPSATFIWRIEIQVPARALDAFEDALQPCCMAISTFRNEKDGGWRIEGLTHAEPDRKAIRRLFAKAARKAGIETPKAKIQLQPPRDWVAENFADFPPIRIGRYFIHGSHFEGVLPAGLVSVKLDAGQAFGSGEHGSTAACLMVLDGLAKKRRFLKPLDMGCGSGILALAMAKTWRVPVWASDIDGEAVRVTARNARLNRLGASVRAARGPGYRTAAVSRARPFDLIVANILTRPLCQMAGDLARHLEPGGVAVVSGFLERDGRRILQAHRAFGLRLQQSLSIAGWQTVVMKG